MDCELVYLATFINNLHIWYTEKYSNEESTKKAFERKIKRIFYYLEKEFMPIINNYKDIQYIPTSDTPKIIWMMWWQGIDKLPPIPQACIRSIRKNLPDYEIRIITKDNFHEFLNVDDVIKYLDEHTFGKKRLIIQHFSDIIRMRILNKFGGMWLDATMFLSGNNFLNLIKKYKFFTIKLIEFPDNKLFFAPGHGRFCTSLFASPAGNPLFSFVDECLTYHVNHHSLFLDYFVSEYAIVLGEKHVNFINKLFNDLPASNPRMFWLDQQMKKEFCEETWNEIKATTDVFKLNWKIPAPVSDKYTFYDFIVNPKLKYDSN